MVKLTHKVNSIFLTLLVTSIIVLVFWAWANANDQELNRKIDLLSPIDIELTPGEKAWLKDHKSIQIGGPQAFPPFHFFDKKNNLKGISADYIISIMKQLGVKINVQANLPWPVVLKRAESGEIDLIPCIAKTDVREKFLSFSTPYLSFPLVIISKKDMPFIGGVEDLYGKKLATIQKISTVEWLERDGINFIPHYVKSPLKGLEAVSFGKADAKIENLAVASYLIQKYGLTNLKVAAPTHYENYNLHMAVRKDLPELLGIINKALHGISPEQHSQIRNKWLSVRYEHGIKKTDVLVWVFSIAGIASLFIVFILFWNKRLQREILEKEKAEKNLKEGERKLSTLIGNLPGIAYRCDTDENRTISYISPGCYELTGYEPFEFENNRILSYGNLIIKEDRQYVRDEILRAIEKRQTFAIEYRIRDKNNKIKWVWEKGLGVFDKKKNLKAIEGFIIDITDRKSTEDALRDSEKKYRHIYKNAPAGIFEIDFEKLKLINVNEVMCTYSGYTEKELLSMNPMDLFTEDSKKLYLERNENSSIRKLMSDNVEYNIIKKNGEKLIVVFNNDFIYKNGKLKGARIVVHDITGLKKAEKEKTKAQKIAEEHKKLALVGQVAGKMAHDFNNILGIIMGNTELSLMECKDTEIKKTLELIFEQTLRGKNLTRNLVAFAKDQEPKQEFFRISEKIDLVFNLLKKDLKDIELIKEDKPGVPDLLADPGMIEHAIINLIQNSIHATSVVEHPKIIIRTYCLNDNIYFEIEDNGCGIPKEHLENIYEPSFTLKGTKDITASYKRGIKGTGYGMANVKKYIEQHKGSIFVESKFNLGTKFTIRLPIIKKELTKNEKEKLQKEKLYFNKTILLVEDEPAISGVQYKILSQEPCHHKVDIANNGKIALDLFDRNKYDLVSLDYLLPGKINGMDVYHQIRKTDQTIPILFISGNIEFLESIKELKQKDINIDHLSKPCRNIDYINGINDLFEKALKLNRR